MRLFWLAAFVISSQGLLVHGQLCQSTFDELRRCVFDLPQEDRGSCIDCVSQDITAFGSCQSVENAMCQRVVECSPSCGPCDDRHLDDLACLAAQQTGCPLVTFCPGTETQTPTISPTEETLSSACATEFEDMMTCAMDGDEPQCSDCQTALSAKASSSFCDNDLCVEMQECMECRRCQDEIQATGSCLAQGICQGFDCPLDEVTDEPTAAPTDMTNPACETNEKDYRECKENELSAIAAETCENCVLDYITTSLASQKCSDMQDEVCIGRRCGRSCGICLDLAFDFSFCSIGKECQCPDDTRSAAAESSSGLSTGATAGISTGVAVVVILVAVGLIFVIRRRRRMVKDESVREFDENGAQSTFPGKAASVSHQMDPEETDEDLPVPSHIITPTGSQTHMSSRSLDGEAESHNGGNYLNHLMMTPQTPIQEQGERTTRSTTYSGTTTAVRDNRGPADHANDDTVPVSPNTIRSDVTSWDV